MLVPLPCFAILSRSSTPRKPDSRASSGVMSGNPIGVTDSISHLAVSHAIAAAFRDMGPRPNPDATSDVAANHPFAKTLGKDHEFLCPTAAACDYTPVISAKRRAGAQLCHPERSWRSRSERQRSRRTPCAPGLTMTRQGVLPEQPGAVVETPFGVRGTSGGHGVLRLRGCFAFAKLVASLRMTGLGMGCDKPWESPRDGTAEYRGTGVAC